MVRRAWIRKAPGMNLRSLCGRKISGRVRFLGDSYGPRKDLRGERGAFVADEDITSLAAFRISARAKTFPTSAPAEKNSHLRPRFATERASRPWCGDCCGLGRFIVLRRSLDSAERRCGHIFCPGTRCICRRRRSIRTSRSCVSLFLGRQFGDERVPIRQPELSRDDFQAIAVREHDVAISHCVSKRSRHHLGVFVCEHDSESSVHGEPEDDQRLHY